MEEQRNRKLLVVEDEIYLQRQIKAMLTERGYEVETASSRAEAVQYILNDTGISLYLLDIWLPDGDGFDLCRLIRQKNMRPVIFLTACDDEESVVKGLDLGRRRLCVKAVPDGGTALADPGKLKKKRKSAVRCDEEWTDPSGHTCQYSTEGWKRSQLKLD